MKILKFIFFLFLGLALILGVSYFFLPAEAHVKRSILVDAEPAEIYPYMNSFENFNKWSPWAKIDPNTTYQYEGPKTGVGARMSWTSDHPDVGNGEQEILETELNKRVKNSMKFGDMPGDHSASLILDPQKDGTLVTWTYDAENIDGFSRFFMPFMDGLLGADYEKGLEGFKQMVENRE